MHYLRRINRELAPLHVTAVSTCKYLQHFGSLNVVIVLQLIHYTWFLNIKLFTSHLQQHVSSIDGTQFAETQPTVISTTDGVYGSIPGNKNQERRGIWHDSPRGNVCVVRPRAPNVTWNRTQHCAAVWLLEAVCPPQLKKSVLTTAEVDNVDHQTS